ncbi:MAG: hypothetical protein WD058_00250 [Dehalococcoidia bacterium]
MILFVPHAADDQSRTYSHELARRLPDIGVLQAPDPAADDDAAWPGSSRVRSTWQSFQLSRHLQRLREPVHLPSEGLARYAMNLRVPYLVTVHGDGSDLGRRDVKALRRAAGLIAFDAGLRDSLVDDLGIAEERVYLVADAPGARETHRIYEALETAYYQGTVNRASDAGFRVALSAPR